MIQINQKMGRATVRLVPPPVSWDRSAGPLSPRDQYHHLQLARVCKGQNSFDFSVTLLDASPTRLHGSLLYQSSHC